MPSENPSEAMAAEGFFSVRQVFGLEIVIFKLKYT
jgi:hypothetical protein